MNAPFLRTPPTSRAFFGPVSNFRLRVQIAPSPRSPRVYFGGGSRGHFFLPPSNPFMNSLLCGEAPLKAASVPASMCALYSCVCVYASASYGCFPPGPGLGVGAAVHLNVASVRFSSPARCRDQRMCNDIAGIPQCYLRLDGACVCVPI